MTILVILQFKSFNLSNPFLSYFPCAKLCLINDLNNVSPAPSPVKGLPVLLAPFLPGARPTINFVELIDPNDLTGLLCQLGYSKLIDFL